MISLALFHPWCKLAYRLSKCKYKALEFCLSYLVISLESASDVHTTQQVDR